MSHQIVLSGAGRGGIARCPSVNITNKGPKRCHGLRGHQDKHWHQFTNNRIEWDAPPCDRWATLRVVRQTPD